jgi:hypothetical protein
MSYGIWVESGNFAGATFGPDGDVYAINLGGKQPVVDVSYWAAFPDRPEVQALQFYVASTEFAIADQ